MSGGAPVYLDPSARLLFVDVVIPNGQSLSDAAPLRSRVLKGMILPSGWTTADITFQAAKPVDPVVPAGTPAPTAEFLDVYGDMDIPVQVDVSGSSRYIVLSTYVGVVNRGWADALAGVDLLKVRSGTPAAPVAQTGGDKRVTLILGASTK